MVRINEIGLLFSSQPSSYLYFLINKDEENCGRKFDDLFLGTVQFNNIDVCL